MTRRSGALLVIALTLLAAGCASYKAQRTAQHAEDVGDWDEAVMLYIELLDREPRNLDYRAGLLRSKLQASREHFAAARKLHEEGKLEAALREYQVAVQFDPSNDFAAVEMRKVIEALANRRAQERGEPTLDELKKQVEIAREQPPLLNPRSDEPIDLSFPNPVSIRDIYDALGKGFGINILFDQTLKDQSLALELQEVRSRDALEMVMRAAAHFYKVLDEHTILVADDSPQNRAKYEDLLIQTFYLSNADPGDLTTVLRSLVGSRNIAANENLNAIVLRDTADKVRVAERIIKANDKSRGEVVVDVELIQIDVNKMRDLGMQLSAYQVSQSLDEDALPIRLSDAQRIGERANWLLTVPGVVYDFMKQDTDVQTLARPQLRISDGETATLHIGDRVPIPVTTFNTGTNVGGNIVPITSFQYQDVGIRIDIEPRIHHNEEITLTLTVEVSNISGNVTGTQGTSQPIIATRTIESTIRLHNGETNMLAGLIQTRDNRSEQGVVGLSEIPLIGRLFSHDSTNRERTDLVLTLTPHIIRTADITPEDLQPIWVGTEQNITFRGGSPRLESEAEGPFDQPARSPEEIRELIRERLERLQEDQQGEPAEGEEPEEPEEQPGQDLAPGSAPRDIFAPRQPEEAPREPQEAPEETPEDPGDLGASAQFDPATDEVWWDEEPGWSADGAASGIDAVTAASTLRLVSLGATPQRERVTPRREGAPPPREGAIATRPPRDGDEPPGSHGDGVRVRLTSSRAAPAPGEEIEVQVHVEAGRPVAHLPLTLEYDSAKLRLLSVERGDFLGGDGEATLLSDGTEAGRLVLGASRLGERPGVAGAGVVARLRFRARAAGSAAITFSQAVARDADLEEIKLVEAAELKLEVRESVNRQPVQRRPRVQRPEA